MSPPDYPVGVEVANAVTHGLGTVMAIVGLVILCVAAALHGTVWHITSFAIFGSTAILMYGTSTIYHALRDEKAKRVFRLLDHSAIYLLIAGTYTPFTLTILRPTVGWWLFGVIWGLAILGIVLKAIVRGRIKILATIGYIAMGWIIVLAWRPLTESVSDVIIRWLIIGGVSYTTGVLFYMMKKVRWSHPLWHLFVAGGTTSHFIAILSLVL